MPRYHNINGNQVQFTAEEETARDAEEQAWADGALARAPSAHAFSSASLAASSSAVNWIFLPLDSEWNLGIIFSYANPNNLILPEAMLPLLGWIFKLLTADWVSAWAKLCS